MPRYEFTGSHELVMHGLQHHVNATVTRVQKLDPDTTVEFLPESTVIAEPGDLIETADPYPHAFMVNADTGETDVPAPDQKPDEADVKRRDGAEPDNGGPVAAVGGRKRRSASGKAAETAQASTAPDPDKPQE